MQRLLSPDAVAWNREHAALWSARADELRASGGVLNSNKAMALDLVVRGLLAAIPAEEASDTDVPELRSEHRSDAVDELARLEARLAVCEPCLYPGTTIMLGVGPIMDAVRQNLRDKIALLRGEPLAPRPIVAQAVVITPPDEAVPFTAGPQLSLFEMAA